VPGRCIRKIPVSGRNGRTQHDIVILRWRALRHATSRVTIELIWPEKANPKRGGHTHPLREFALERPDVHRGLCGGKHAVAGGAAVVPVPLTANQ
jgi:hypothetical protein